MITQVATVREEAAEAENEVLAEDAQGAAEAQLTEQEREALERILRAVDSMSGEDPKLQAVRHFLVEEGWAQLGCIVFSQYFDTARWIAGRLTEPFPDQLIGVYAGGSKSLLLRGGEESQVGREDLKRMVERHEIRLVVATDAACEGLNLQKLGTLINIDLPWNPTRLEQRIGRIKRFGQVRAEVDMLNLVYQDTVDETIYNRLSERMKNKYDIFGSLPDTIDDGWVDDEEKLEEELQKYIEARERVNGFDLRYNAALAEDEDTWRDCAKVLSHRQLDELMRRGW